MHRHLYSFGGGGREGGASRIESHVRSRVFSAPSPLVSGRGSFLMQLLRTRSGERENLSLVTSEVECGVLAVFRYISVGFSYKSADEVQKNLVLVLDSD